MGTDEQPDVEAVLRDLEDPDEQTRRAALFSCARLGENAVRAIPYLQRIVGQDPSIELRYLARKTLGAFAAQAETSGSRLRVRRSAGMTQQLSMSTVEMVTIKLASDDPNVRGSAYRAAAMKRDVALLEPLLAKVGADQEPDVELRSLLVRVLAIVGGKQVLKSVAGHIKDPDARVRANTIEVLAQYQDIAAYAAIVHALQDPDHRVVVAAVTALQTFGALNLLKIGSVMLRSSAYWNRDAAAYMLSAAKIPEALPLLKGGLTDEHESVRIKCMSGIKRLAEAGDAEAQQILEEAQTVKDREGPLDFLAIENQPPAQLEGIAVDFASQDVTKRRVATRQVADGGIVDEGHIPLLLAQLKVETDTEVQVNILTALGQIKKPVVLAVLQDYMAHPDARVRCAMADTLAAIGTEAALQMAVKLLDDASPSVKGRAILALRYQPSVDLLPPLESMAAGPVESRSMACMLIAQLNDRKYLGVLDRLSSDPDTNIAEMAMDAASELRA